MTIVASDPLLDGGLLPADRAREAWWVRSGAATAVAVRPGDRVSISGLAGGRTAEVTVVGADGRADPGALGLDASEPAGVLRGLVADRQALSFLRALNGGGFDPLEARCARLLGADAAPGAAEQLRVDRAATLVVATPADGPDDEPALPGALLLELWRADPTPRGEIELPAPLAEPRLDFRVDAASALAYEVKAGEYIQIIDVAGRQCSDFLAFRADALGRGLERGLDATTTRTLTGNAFPTPGLNNKFFDQDMRPLVEIVRDTVGRHDAFALACTARYYEDLGYPGHRNCSENFNGQLAPYAIAERPGWPALNFFYNTAFDADNVLVLDEPWSRAGDHVLLRASTDLVCASSACPDDIDPSNGWEVTDVHVRVYAPDNRFSMAVTRRMAPGVEPVTTRETAFHARISALTASMCETGGYWVADRFDGHGAVEEYWACRERVAVMDLSHLRKWEVLGPDAETLMQRIVTRDVRKLAVGQVVYTAICQDTGGMLDDATVFRMTDDNFRLIGGCDGDGPWLLEQAEASGLRVHVKPASDALHNLAVQGPASRDVLREIVWTRPGQPALDDLRWFRFLVGRIGHREGTPIVVSRTGYTGELGYEVFCHPDDGTAVWDAVMAAGEAHGIVPLGLDALDMLRVEAGLILAGHEFDQDTDPFEAGIGFTVALDADEDFVGRAALLERREHPQRRLVGLNLDGDEVPSHGDGVFVGRRRVGVVTSAVHSPTFKRAIALCRMAVTDAEPGTAVEVSCNDGLYRRLAATVTTIPFYDPKKERPRS
jgi:glycine cleavage system T protein (aminomethyltransferase)